MAWLMRTRLLGVFLQLLLIRLALGASLDDLIGKLNEQTAEANKVMEKKNLTEFEM